MNILGISAFFHDSAAALLQDGRIVAAAQEERFTRRKHDDSFPAEATRWCLQEAGIGIADLDAVVFYEKPLVKFERLLETALAFAPRGFPAFVKAMPVWLQRKLHIPREIDQGLDGAYSGPICFATHHESHAASGFYPSPFDEAAILTLDGVGEWSTATWGTGRGNQIRLEAEMRFPHSPGLLYSAFTLFCGFRVNSGEYKLMGLAPYGDPCFADALADAVAEHLAAGRIVGHFAGRAEFGPRALGNRSILADPRQPEMQRRLNLAIKFRESFRPFAPAVIAGREREFFDLATESPYMLLVAPVLGGVSPMTAERSAGLDRLCDVRGPLPAVTHVDGSARVQTADPVRSPRLHAILGAFARRTGCPVLANTSFNIRGEPIVHDPADAYRCFMFTDMDVLVVGNRLLRKDRQPPLPGAEAYKRSFRPD